MSHEELESKQNASTFFLLRSNMPSTRKRGQLVQRMNEPQWFPRSSDELESRLDVIERNEEAYAAKQRSLAQVIATAPIGVTPNVLVKIEKQIHDGPEICKKSKDEYFWNRKYGSPKMDEFYAKNRHQMDTPTSRASEAESFNLDTPVSQQSAETMALDVSGF